MSSIRHRLTKLARGMTEKEYQDARRNVALAGGLGAGVGGLHGHGLLGPVAAGAVAPDGQGLRTGAYGLGGMLGGAILGSALTGGSHHAAALGAGLGTALGARHAIRKEASIAEYAALADQIESGTFGKEAQYAFEGILSAVENHIEDDTLEKNASIGEINYTIEEQNAARIARLEQLLKR